MFARHVSVLCVLPAVPGLHAGEGAARDGVHAGRVRQNEGKARRVALLLFTFVAAVAAHVVGYGNVLSFQLS